MAPWAFEYVRHLSYNTGGARWVAVGGNHGGIKKEGVYVHANVEFLISCWSKSYFFKDDFTIIN